MNIRKDHIPLDRRFPFKIMDSKKAPGYKMDGVYHWHECLEISYVKSGRGRYYIEDKIYEMEPGNIIIINNIEPHYLEVYEEEMQQPVMVFEPSLVWSSGGCSLDYEYLKPFFERGTNFSNKLDLQNPAAVEIMEHIKMIEKEYADQPEGYELMIKSRLLTILTYLIRHFRDSEKLSSEHTSKRQCIARLEEVLKYISGNFDRDVKLEEVASRIYVTPQYFSSFFKRAMGTSFVDYINHIRVNRAVELLKGTDMKITRIATECGFNNTVNFNGMFKKFTGKTPSEFR